MTHPTNTPTAVTAAAAHAAASWTLFAREKGYSAAVDAWHTEHTPDGTPLITGQVTGRGAGYALARFARDFYVVLKPGMCARSSISRSPVGRSSRGGTAGCGSSCGTPKAQTPPWSPYRPPRPLRSSCRLPSRHRPRGA